MQTNGNVNATTLPTLQSPDLLAQLLLSSQQTNSRLDQLNSLMAQLVEAVVESKAAPVENAPLWEDSEIFEPIQMGEVTCIGYLPGFEELRIFERGELKLFRLRDFNFTHDGLNIAGSINNKMEDMNLPVHTFRSTCYGNNQSKDNLIKTIFIEMSTAVRALSSLTPRSKYRELANKLIAAIETYLQLNK